VASSVDDAREFFRRFYHPSNASIAIAGDVDTDATLALVERYFGEIASGPAVVHPRRDAALAAPARLVLEDRVELPRLSLAWHTPAMFHDDDAAMDIAADVLSNGKTSRLYRALVYETRLAADVSALQASREMSSVFHISATAAPGQSLAAIAEVVERTLDDLAATGPTTDELERATARAEAQFVYRVQTIGGFGGKSDQLNAYNVFTGRPASSTPIAALRACHGASVAAAAAGCARRRGSR
jgi:zinc protease